MKKYQITKDYKEYRLKKGMVFEWDEVEKAYTTKSLPWFLTPMIEKEEMKERIKLGQLEKVE